MFVALEGSDGSGKSTLCAILASRLGATSYATPPPRYLALRERVDQAASPEEHYRFYRDGIYEASCEIEAILAGGGKVVVDRYWLTTFTYHRVMGVPVSVDDFQSIIMPTLTVILALNKDVQIERMSRRGLSAGDRRMFGSQEELAAAFYRHVLEFKIPFLVIDSGRFKPEACAEIIVSALSCAR